MKSIISKRERSRELLGIEFTIGNIRKHRHFFNIKDNMTWIKHKCAKYYKSPWRNLNNYGLFKNFELIYLYHSIRQKVYFHPSLNCNIKKILKILKMTHALCFNDWTSLYILCNKNNFSESYTGIFWIGKSIIVSIEYIVSFIEHVNDYVDVLGIPHQHRFWSKTLFNRRKSVRLHVFHRYCCCLFELNFFLDIWNIDYFRSSTLFTCWLWINPIKFVHKTHIHTASQ